MAMLPVGRAATRQPPFGTGAKRSVFGRRVSTLLVPGRGGLYDVLSGNVIAPTGSVSFARKDGIVGFSGTGSFTVNTDRIKLDKRWSICFLFRVDGTVGSAITRRYLIDATYNGNNGDNLRLVGPYDNTDFRRFEPAATGNWSAGTYVTANPSLNASQWGVVLWTNGGVGGKNRCYVPLGTAANLYDVTVAAPYGGAADSITLLADGEGAFTLGPVAIIDGELGVGEYRSLKQDPWQLFRDDAASAFYTATPQAARFNAPLFSPPREPSPDLILDDRNPIARRFQVAYMPGVSNENLATKSRGFPISFPWPRIRLPKIGLTGNHSSAGHVTSQGHFKAQYPLTLIWIGQTEDTANNAVLAGLMAADPTGSHCYIGGGSSTLLSYTIRNNYSSTASAYATLTAAVNTPLVIVGQSLSATDHRVSANGSVVGTSTTDAGALIAWDGVSFGASSYNRKHGLFMVASGGKPLTDDQMRWLSSSPANVYSLFRRRSEASFYTSIPDQLRTYVLPWHKLKQPTAVPQISKAVRRKVSAFIPTPTGMRRISNFLPSEPYLGTATQFAIATGRDGREFRKAGSNWTAAMGNVMRSGAETFDSFVAVLGSVVCDVTSGGFVLSNGFGSNYANTTTVGIQGNSGVTLAQSNKPAVPYEAFGGVWKENDYRIYHQGLKVVNNGGAYGAGRVGGLFEMQNQTVALIIAFPDQVLPDGEMWKWIKSPWSIFEDPISAVLYAGAAAAPSGIPSLSLAQLIDLLSTSARPRVTLTF